MNVSGHYERPSEKKVREKAEAIRRARKRAHKKPQREGLLPMKPRVIRGVPGRGGPARVPSLLISKQSKPRLDENLGLKPSSMAQSVQCRL